MRNAVCAPMARRAGFGLVVLLAAACSSNGGDVGDGGDGGGVADGGDGGVVTGGCNPAKLPTEDTCVINDVEGIFVSSSMGTAAGDGTKAKPFASLQAGIAAATPAKKRVYACAETYAETITLADGVSIFGYFDCAKGWTVSTSHAKVQPTTSPAATATNITDPTRVEAVDLIAPSFTGSSQSSIGIIVVASPALTIANAVIHAGTGGAGAKGTNGTTLTESTSTKNGHNSWTKGVCTSTLCNITAYIGGAAGGTNTCTGATGHDGGNGGNGGAAGEYQSIADSSGITYHWSAVSGHPTTGGNANPATAQTALGGPVGQYNGGVPGLDGAPGANGNSGGAVGTFTASGYTPSDGTAGGDGQPGQGGGGAGAYGLQDLSIASRDQDVNPQSFQGDYGWGEAGAGGGAGGCPGLAGTPGKGGGASVAIVALQSPFLLDHVTVETSSGGAGGAAGTPSTPSPGGTGGTGGSPPSYTSPAFPMGTISGWTAHAGWTGSGGKGGSGGAAGVSGNGGGGPSIGLVYQGTEPTHTTATITPGQGGSPNGLSQDKYSF